MTLSASSAWDLTAEEIITRALQLAGVLGAGAAPQAGEYDMGYSLLNGILHEWQAAAKILRCQERTTLALVAGQAAYVLPADTVDVEFPAAVVVGGIDYAIVERLTLQQYTVITNKTMSGISSRILVERQAAITITLYPVPNASCVTLKYTRQRLVKDVEAGKNVELHGRALLALVRGLACDFAEHYGKSDGKIARLEGRYREARQTLFSDNIERGDVQFYLEAF